jgi:ATP-dependent exoDNAse (exonuclease V) beta subunit
LERRFAELMQAVPASNVLLMSRAFSSSSPLQAGNGKVALAAAAHEPLQVLRRLPSNCFSDPGPEIRQPAAAATSTVSAMKDARRDSRLARVQGIVLHALLERLAVGSSGDHPDWGRLAHSLLRQHGLSRANLQSAHDAVTRGLRNALEHDEGRWLLAGRTVIPDEQSRDERSGNETSWNETSWTSASSGRMLRQRPDRVFFGGESPGEPGAEYLWIVDYKTGPLPEGTSRESFLAASREQYRSQLESYSELFRKLSDLDPAAAHRAHRLAIYHPMLPWLDWWSA